MRKAQKKIAEENLQKAIELTTKITEKAISEGKAFCISRVNVGLDPAAVHEAVIKVLQGRRLLTFNLSHYQFCYVKLYISHGSIDTFSSVSDAAYISAILAHSMRPLCNELFYLMSIFKRFYNCVSNRKIHL